MLILNRKIGQSILIGSNVTVTVTKVTFDQQGNPEVELGTDAPEYISVDRPEVRKRKRERVARIVNANTNNK